MSDGRNGQSSDADAGGEGDPFDSLDEPATDFDEVATDVDDPFAELGPGVDGDAPNIEGDGPDEGATVDSGDDAFERMDVAGPAEEDVWEFLDADAEGTDAFGDAAFVSGRGDTEHVVSKRTYCQQCPHFASPPEVACAHEGTSILEAVGFDEFRVRNCPMVSEEDPTFDSGE